ncbi:CHAT domain-containing protein [Amylostereum chailletii]|nr:CHAT domain-containing protein [Amylostereum chailletii]
MPSIVRDSRESDTDQDTVPTRDSGKWDSDGLSDAVRDGSEVKSLHHDDSRSEDTDTVQQHIQHGHRAHPHDAREKEDLDNSNDTVLLQQRLQLKAILSVRGSENYVDLRTRGESLLAHFGEHGHFEDLDDAIQILTDYRDAGLLVDCLGLCALGYALLKQYGRLGQEGLLLQAMFYHTEALKLCASDKLNRPASLNNFELAARKIYDKTHRIDDLQHGIIYLREALDLHPPGHPDRSHYLQHLACAISTRFDRLGQVDDLEQAVVYFQEALDLHPQGHPDRANYLNDAGSAIWIRHRILGQIDDLEQAIRFHQEALMLCPHGHPGRPVSLSDLAFALATRHETLGQKEDLEQAIVYFQETLDMHPPGEPHRVIPLNNLANALLDRYDVLRKIEDLEQAIVYYQEAVDLYVQGDSNQFIGLNNLATALSTRYDIFLCVDDLEQAIIYLQEALSLLSQGHHYRSQTLHNLAGTTIKCYDMSQGDIKYLEQAIVYYQEALKLSPQGHPSQSSSLHSLGHILQRPYEALGKKEDLDNVVEILSEVVYDIHGPIETRLNAAQSWISFVQKNNHASLLLAYRAALEVFISQILLHPNIVLRYRLIDHSWSLTGLNATSEALNQKEYHQAIELLEQGRAIIWSTTKGLRPTFERTSLGSNYLLNELEMLCTALEQMPISTGSYENSERYSNNMEKWAQQRKFIERREQIITQIRQLPGQEHFLKATPYSLLSEAALFGPVIVVNLSEFRSDALILPSPHVDPIIVSLASAQMESSDLVDVVSKLAHKWSVITAINREDDGRSRIIQDILFSLWNLIVQPIIAKLQELKVPKLSRIWWCPTRELCTLPLHAAQPPHGPGVSDLYISSYTSTLGSLLAAHKAHREQSVPPSLFVIGIKDSLPQVTDELAAVRESVGSIVKMPYKNHIDQDLILESLAKYPWAHIACHGNLEKFPFDSHFKLSGQNTLRVIDIMRANLDNAELAFLSACHSAAVDKQRNYDEVIHLAAAMQFAGFKSVIGTLWGMADEDGPMVARAFYKAMLKFAGGDVAKLDYRNSAKALHMAVRVMRRNGVPLDRWVNFVHIGA